MAEDRDVLLTKKEKESWGSDKTPRRRLIAEDFRIVLMIGDNLGDFLGETEVEAAKRRAKVAAHPDRWGKSWIVLPNPVYGDWEATTFGYDWSLERQERIKRKLNALETLEGSQP
jgi:acid phosphatase